MTQSILSFILKTDGIISKARTDPSTYTSIYSLNSNCGPRTMVANVLTSAEQEGAGWLLERGGGWGALLCNSEEIPFLSPSKQYFSLETKAATAHIHAQQNRCGYKWFSV